MFYGFNKYKRRWWLWQRSNYIMYEPICLISISWLYAGILFWFCCYVPCSFRPCAHMQCKHFWVIVQHVLTQLSWDAHHSTQAHKYILSFTSSLDIGNRVDCSTHSGKSLNWSLDKTPDRGEEVFHVGQVWCTVCQMLDTFGWFVLVCGQHPGYRQRTFVWVGIEIGFISRSRHAGGLC